MSQASVHSAELRDLGLKELVQIGFVVKDLETAIAHYEPLFGPFKRTEFGTNYARYHGGPRSPYELKIAFGHSGDLEIELIEWVSGDTPHRDFLDAGREGMHHVQFRIDGCEAWMERLKGVGYEPIWWDRMTPEIAYAYCERRGDPLIVELLEYPMRGDPTEPLP